MSEGTAAASDLASARLVVLLHAYKSGPSRLESIRATVLSLWPDAEVYCPQLPTSLFSMADPDGLAEKLLRAIDDLVERRASSGVPIASIVFVGHSIGGLLARKVYVVACGQTERAPFGSAFSLTAPRTWSTLVDRIVLLAGMNRGWRVSHHLSLLNAPLWAVGAAACHVIRAVRGRWPLIYTVRQGAEFITELRVQWILMRQSSARSRARNIPAPGDALTIQLLGSRDDLVAPEDNVDLVSGGDFVYLDVPYTGHREIVELDDIRHGPERREVLAAALTKTRAELDAMAVVPADEKFTAPDEGVTKVLFVIHGIRDVGYWTHKIARRVKQRAAGELRQWATETSSYGYFPMLPFIFPWYRRKKVEWLMDQYTEALARYPNASFYYVGHSNGTYLLARALELYPSCRFEHVVFAGSVVRRRYDWRRFLAADPPRVKAVLNFVATGDWVVAFFPKFFEFLRMQDLGSAGHDGFLQDEVSELRLYRRGYVHGGHSAAIAEPVWDVIADFVLRGKPPVAEVPGSRKTRKLWVWLGGIFPPAVWALIAYGVWKLGEWIAAAIGSANLPGTTQGIALGVALSFYALILWLVLTRV